MAVLTRSKLLWIVGFCVLGIAINAAGVGPTYLRAALRGDGDFRGLYSGAVLVGTGDLHDPAALAELHIKRFGEAYPALAPMRIPAYYVLLRPFAWLDYSTAAALWKGIMLALLVAAIALEPLPRVAVVAFSACGATILALGSGQDLPLVVVAISLFRRWRQSSPTLAGVAFCLAALAKPHLVILVPLTLLVLREWKILRSLAAGAALAAGVCFWTEGPGWAGSWIGTALTAGTNAGPQAMPNLHGLVAAAGGGAILEWIGVAAIAAMVALNARRATPQLSLFVALLGSLLVSRHAYLHDVLLVVPGMGSFFLATNPVYARAAAAWILSPAPFWLVLLLDRGPFLQLPLLGVFLLSVWKAPDLRGTAYFNLDTNAERVWGRR